jgi:23S rRNA pseudouridine2605 synthase
MRTNASNEPIRLNRYLALLGMGSRRACDELILAGKVIVDGKRVEAPGMTVIPGLNRVSCGGAVLESPPHRIVLLMNKPEGIVTTADDPQKRTTVIDLCRRHRFTMRLFPVGRLDINTSGAILLTNDGLLCYRLTHPRFGVPKTYIARVRGMFTEKKLRRLIAQAAGEREHKTRGPNRARVSVVKVLEHETILQIVLYEGQNRQVRTMCESSGFRIVKLKRVQFGPISIRKLPVGAVRPLTRRESKMLDALMSPGGK